MNLPNTLTLSRLVLAFVLVPLLLIDIPYLKTAALVVFVIGGITDYLDGYLARNVYGVTSFGKLMDPVTDKVMVCAAFVSFVQLNLVHAFVAVVIIAREFMVTGLRLLALEQGTVISAGKWGKHKTVWQIVAIIIILLGLAIQHDVLGRLDPGKMPNFEHVFGITAHAVSIAVALITVASGLIYLHSHRDLIVQNM